MDDAIIGALEEGRVDCHHRPVIHGRHAGGKDHRVFLGDAHIEITSGQLIPQRLQPRTTRHGRRHAHHFVSRSQSFTICSPNTSCQFGAVPGLPKASRHLRIVRPQAVKFFRRFQAAL